MKKILIVMLTLFLLVGTALAYDASNSWTGTVRWTIPSDTTFTVTFATGMDKVYFNATTAYDKQLQAQGQNNATDVPVLELINSGNVKLNFTCNLTEAKPTWAVLYVNNVTAIETAKTFDTGQSIAVVNDSINAGDKTPMYLWTSITMADLGVTDRTLMIDANTT